MDIREQAERLANKTKHYLINTMGRVFDEANTDEIYRALCYSLREEIMINWIAATRTFDQADARTIYYLSMEYLPGRIFTNNVQNLSSHEIVLHALQRLDRSFKDVALCEQDPGLGNGGLGRLASCFLDSLATLHYPAIGYGLRYQYGIFEQQIWDGQQIEAPDLWLVHDIPWEFRRDLRRVDIEYCGTPQPTTNIHGEEIFTLKNPERVYALAFDIPIVGRSDKEKFGVVPLRLWSTKESPRNFQLQSFNAGRLDQAAENMALTDVLYPNDFHEMGKRIRLKQEYLLVSASLQDIIRHYLKTHDNFRDFADKVRIQINDTHPALIIPELIRLLFNIHDLPWKMAVEITQAVTSYTNHTILSEALEVWEKPLLHYLLPRHLKLIEKLNFEFCNQVRQKYPKEEERVRRLSIIQNDRVHMAHLSIAGSHAVNGVAALHTEILKNKVFKDFYDFSPEKFINVTNGVTHRRWLLHCNPALAQLITKRIGTGWITDFTQIAQLAEHASDPECQDEFLRIKRKNKERLVQFLSKHNPLRNEEGIIIGTPPVLDPTALFDIQVKRMHEYKRQLMNILHGIILYQEILQHPELNRPKRVIIVGGKAAAGYETAKEIIRFIWCVGRKINRDPAVKGQLKVVYVENYNVSKAEIIIPAADLSEQISVAGMEASGTGNMKFTMNGALTIGTDDGANIEMREAVTDQWWPFKFGHSADEIAQLQDSGSYSPAQILEDHPALRAAVDTLRDRTFAQNDDEHVAFSDIYHKLLEQHYGGPPDRYFTLLDLADFHDTQKRVEKLWHNPNAWAEMALYNIAGMGTFSTDTSIHNYAEKIWGLTPLPQDPEILETVRNEFMKQDVCRIL